LIGFSGSGLGCGCLEFLLETGAGQDLEAKASQFSLVDACVEAHEAFHARHDRLALDGIGLGA